MIPHHLRLFKYLLRKYAIYPQRHLGAQAMPTACESEAEDVAPSAESVSSTTLGKRQHSRHAARSLSASTITKFSSLNTTADEAAHLVEEDRQHPRRRARVQRQAGVDEGRISMTRYRAYRNLLAELKASGYNPAMDIVAGIAGAVGNTPLIELVSLSKATGRRILAKAEHMNPGGSVKDRAAKWMIEAAERAGSLRPGGTVVEGTAGNTGIGLALMCRARGYRCVIVMPNNQSAEKVTLLRALGAEVELVAPAPFQDDTNYYHRARARAQEQSAFFANQFENTANALSHVESTGPEIWRQTDGQISAFVCSSGTGGTIGGVSSYLKSRDPSVQCFVVDCAGSSLFAHVTAGTLSVEDPAETSVLEGIGIRRITANFAQAKLDGALRASDADAIEMVHWLLRREGLFVGGSAGLNCVGAVLVARKLPKGSTIVTVLTEGGQRSQSRLFNDEWLSAQHLTPKRVESWEHVS
jgi:cysteine synthase A